jgi:hypothetical protein
MAKKKFHSNKKSKEQLAYEASRNAILGIPQSKSDNTSTSLNKLSKAQEKAQEQLNYNNWAKGRQTVSTPKEVSTYNKVKRILKNPTRLMSETNAMGARNPFKVEDDNPLTMVSPTGFAGAGMQVPQDIAAGNYGHAALNTLYATGVGSVLAKPGVKAAGNVLNRISRYPLNESNSFLKGPTGIKAAYKYNPWAWKPDPNAYYRMLGKEGYKDAMKVNALRPNPKSTGNFMMESSSNKGKVWLNKGMPVNERIDPNSVMGYKGPYFAETKNPNIIPSQGKGKRIYGHTEKPIPLDDVKFYKEHWLQGYKQVKGPTSSAGDQYFSTRNEFFKTPGETPVKKLTDIQNNAFPKSISTIDDIKADRVFKTDESRNITKQPWNRTTDKSVQSEFIKEQTDYMNSDAFADKMKEYYPDINIEDYKKVILHNLKAPIEAIPPNIENPSNFAGFYMPKSSVPEGSTIMDKNSLTFRSKLNLAAEEMDKPAFQSRWNAGRSFTNNLGSTVEHELGHQRTNADWLLPDHLKKDFLLQNATTEGKALGAKEGDASYGLSAYHSKPTEFDTRLLNMKRDLKRQNLIDYTTSNEFTPEHIKKLKLTENVERRVPKSERLKDVEDAYKVGDISPAKYKRFKHFYEKGYINDQVSLTSTRHGSQDSESLLKYWSPEFLADQMRKLPAVAAPIGLAGAAGVTEFKNGGPLNNNNMRLYDQYRQTQRKKKMAFGGDDWTTFYNQGSAPPYASPSSLVSGGITLNSASSVAPTLRSPGEVNSMYAGQGGAGGGGQKGNGVALGIQAGFAGASLLADATTDVNRPRGYYEESVGEKRIQGALKYGAQGASLGASIGSAVAPEPGTAIGATIGGTLGGVGGYFKGAKDEKDHNEEVGKRHAAFKQSENLQLAMNSNPNFGIGNRHSQMMAMGGSTKTYTDKKQFEAANKSYTDSMNLYKAYRMQDKLMGPGSEPIKEGRTKRYDRGLNMAVAKDFQSETEQFADGYNAWTSRKEDKQLLDYYKKLGFKPNQIMYHSSPDIISDDIKAIGTYHDGTARSPIYMKPRGPKPTLQELTSMDSLGPRKLNTTTQFTPPQMSYKNNANGYTTEPVYGPNNSVIGAYDKGQNMYFPDYDGTYSKGSRLESDNPYLTDTEYLKKIGYGDVNMLDEKGFLNQHKGVQYNFRSGGPLKPKPQATAMDQAYAALGIKKSLPAYKNPKQTQQLMQVSSPKTKEGLNTYEKQIIGSAGKDRDFSLSKHPIDTPQYLANKMMLENVGSPDIDYEPYKNYEFNNVKNKYGEESTVASNKHNSRSITNPLTNTLHIKKAKALLSEVPHVAQNQKHSAIKRLASDWMRDPYFTSAGQERQYEIEGSYEHEAHSVMEPKLRARHKVVQDSLQQRKNARLEYYRNGGSMGNTPKLADGFKQISNNAVDVVGPTHEQGGVDVPGTNKEVEGGGISKNGYDLPGEVIMKDDAGDYVFSDKLKPDGKQTFAELYRSLSKKKNALESQPTTQARVNSIKRVIQREQGLKMKQERMRQFLNLE